MSELPSGTVTLLFTDIEGSTRLLRHLGDAYAGVLDAHQRLLRAAFAAHDGREVDTQGDAFFVGFARATDALAAAADAQRALAAWAWPEGGAVRVRMGLHTGELDGSGGRYVGLAVHRAARIGAAARGGQVLLSAATRAVAQDRLPDGLALRDLGDYPLKDFERPERLYQLDIAGLPTDFPPLTLAPAGDPPAALLSLPGPLAGREREQGTLRDLGARLLAGQGGLALLGGEAGIGKTALAEDLARELAARGALVLVGRCYDLTETPPYGPWRELFAHAPAGAAPPLAPEDAPPGPAALFGEVRAALARLARDRALVLLLDDLHWADPASLELLRALARELAALPALILVTYRADELTRRHPLATMLPLLVREAQAVPLELRRLDRDAVRALAAARYPLPEEAATRLVDYLFAHAEGNPFYCGELLRSLEEEGLVRRAGANWALGDLARARLPRLLRQVIDGRLARLDEEAQRLLGIAAIVGQQVPLALWATVADTTEEALIDVIEAAIAARLLEPADGGEEFRFVHALIREALYEVPLPPRRRQWHRRVAEALIAAPRADPDLVASHLQRAGDPRAADWLIRAGERAQRSYALLTAAGRFEAALSILEARDGDPLARAGLLYRLARMRRYDDPRGALAYLDDAEALATGAGDEFLAAYIACARGYLRCSIGQVRAGLDEMTARIAAFDALDPAGRERLAAMQAALGDPPDEHHYRATLASWLALAGRYAEALPQAEHVLRAGAAPARRGAGTSYVANAYRGLASAHAALGHPEEARRGYERAADAYRAAEHWYQLGNTLGLALYEVALPYAADDLAGRARLAAEAEAAWGRASDALADLPRHLAHLPLLLLEGSWDEADALARAVRAPGSRTQWRPFASSHLARLARDRGDAVFAWSLIRERLPDGAGGEPGDAIFLDTLALQRLAAALALDAGDLAAARSWLDAHERWSLWADCLLGQAEAHLLRARYLHLSGDLPRARDVAAEALRQASSPRQPLDLLAAHRALGEYAAALGDHDGALAHLAAALDLAAACTARYEHALCLAARAAAHAAAGAHDRAREDAAAARSILAALGATPALAALDALEEGWSSRAAPSGR